MERLIIIRELTVKFNSFVALEDINLDFHRGEFMAIVGPNGGGKTTLLKSILGLIKPSRGEIVLHHSLLALPPRKRFGYLPQQIPTRGIFPARAIDIVLMAFWQTLSPFTFPGKKEKKKALEMLELIGIKDVANEPYFTLSGGQKQRVQLARALVFSPPVLLLDEPSAGIDVVGQADFYNIITQLKAERNMSIFMVTHDIGGIGGFVDRVACLQKKLVCHGAPEVLEDEEVISKLYGVGGQRLSHDHGQ